MYLSANGGKVDLPTAALVRVHSNDRDEIAFCTEDGRLVAVFRREDLFLYSMTDLTEENSGASSGSGLKN